MNWRVKWEDILFGSPEKNKKLERQGSKLSLVRVRVTWSIRRVRLRVTWYVVHVSVRVMWSVVHTPLSCLFASLISLFSFFALFFFLFVSSVFFFNWFFTYFSFTSFCVTFIPFFITTAILCLQRNSYASSASGDTIAFHLSDAGNRQLFTKTGYYKVRNSSSV